MNRSVISEMQKDLTPVEKEIIDFLRDNPGSSKADIIRHLRDKQMSSRMTVLEYIKDLETKNMVYGRRKQPNSLIIRMYVNNDSELLTIITGLEEFKKAYFNLLKKSKEKINNKDYSEDCIVLGIKEFDPAKWSEEDKSRYEELELRRLKESLKESSNIIQSYEYKKISKILSGDQQDKKPDFTKELKTFLTSYQNYMKRYGERITFLIMTPVKLFHIMTDIMFYRSVFRWPEQISDKEILSQMYSISYNKIVEIQIELSAFLKSINVIPIEPVNTIVSARGDEYDAITLNNIADTYHTIQMDSEIEGVVNSIMNLNEDIKDFKLFGLDTIIPTHTILEKINGIIDEHEKNT